MSGKMNTTFVKYREIIKENMQLYYVMLHLNKFT